MWSIVSNGSVEIRIKREEGVELEGSKVAAMHLQDYREGAVEERLVHRDAYIGEIGEAGIKSCLLQRHMIKVFQLVDGVVDGSVGVRIFSFVYEGQGSDVRHIADHLRHLWRTRIGGVIWYCKSEVAHKFSESF